MRSACSRPRRLLGANIGGKDGGGACAHPSIGNHDNPRDRPRQCRGGRGHGLRPQDLQSAYFPGEAPDAPASEPQTIAIVDAYDDLEAESDLAVYDNEFQLPACTASNGCFEQVNQNGETGNLPFPESNKAKTEKEALCESATA